MPIDSNDYALLSLLQLASPALPVGAYSYSEGLEMLVETGIIKNQQSLKHWLEQELSYGTIRLEAAVMVRAYQAAQIGNHQALIYWNNWLSAARETEELRRQSWQMGQSLMRLLLQLQPELQSEINIAEMPWNFAIAFGITANYWQINAGSALLGYLHSWVTNAITAGVKLIPLGQTSGQKLMLELQVNLVCATKEIFTLEDEAIATCGWGLSLASMTHETQYTRLFRS